MEKEHPLVLSFSWKTAYNHFFFFGCLMSPVQTRTEREFRLQGFPDGFLCRLTFTLTSGSGKSRTFTQAKGCPSRSSKNIPPLSKQQETTLLSPVGA